WRSYVQPMWRTTQTSTRPAISPWTISICSASPERSSLSSTCSWSNCAGSTTTATRLSWSRVSLTWTARSKKTRYVGAMPAYLTNQIVVAEACDPGELAEVRRCAELAHDYLNIGLTYRAQGKESEAARLLHEIRLRPFFQVGASLTLRLQQRAKQLDAALQADGIPGRES